MTTVALMMSETPHIHDGCPAYTVAVHDAASGSKIGSYVVVLAGPSAQTYILPTGQKLDSRRHSIDTVIRAIVRSANQEIAA